MAKTVLAQKMTRMDIRKRLQQALACVTIRHLSDYRGPHDVVSYPAVWARLDKPEAPRVEIHCPQRMPGRVMAIRVAMEHITDGYSGLGLGAVAPRTLREAVEMLYEAEVEVL